MNYLKRLLLLTALLTFVGAHAFALTRYPVPSCDEAHYANVGLVFLETGRFGDDMLGKDNLQANNLPWVGRLPAINLALLFHFFGVSLFVARLFSFVGFVVAALGVNWAETNAFGRTTGRVGAVFFVLTWITFMHSHNGRPDIWIAAGGILSFACLLQTVRSAQAKWAALAGLLPVVTMDFHLNGAHFLVASGIILTFWAARRRAWRCWLAFVATVVGGLIVWYIGHYLINPFPSNFLAAYATRTMGISSAQKILNLIDWWWRQYWVGTRYELLPQGAYFAVGVIALLIRRETAGRILVLYIALSALSFGLILQVQADYYRIVWMPLVALVAAAGVQTIAENIRRRWPLNARWSSLLPAALAAPLLAIYLLSDAYLLYKFRDVSYEGMISRFEAVIPAGSRVAAEATWWYGLGSKYEFLDNILFYEGTRRLGSQTMEEGLIGVLKKGQFDYVIYDGRIGCNRDPSPASLALDRVLPEQCSAILTIEDKWFGEQTVYRCSGSAAHSP